jgi:hypothetical protein
MSLAHRGSEDCHPPEPTSPQAAPTDWHALLERMELGVAEINQNAEMVRRSLGGEGLSFRGGGDSLEVTRAARPVRRLRVTNHGLSVSAEWETASGGQRRSPLMFDTDPNWGTLLRKECGARMILDEAVRYLLTPLLSPRP